MADSTNSFAIPPRSWSNLYELYNFANPGNTITVGTQIMVINVGSGEARLYSGAAAPTGENAGIPLPVYKAGVNESGDAGAWIYGTAPIRVNVRAA